MELDTIGAGCAPLFDAVQPGDSLERQVESKEFPEKSSSDIPPLFGVDIGYENSYNVRTDRLHGLPRAINRIDCVT